MNTETSLGEARDWLRARSDKGAICPCCKQFTKVYKRRIYTTMARMLILFYHLPKATDWIHVTAAIKDTGCADFRSGEWAKLKYWGLIEEKKKSEDKDAKNSGYWRLTKLGSDFVEKKVRVYSHINLYDGRFLGFTGEYVYIDECLNKNFSYAELMGGIRWL